MPEVLADSVMTVTCCWSNNASLRRLLALDIFLLKPLLACDSNSLLDPMTAAIPSRPIFF
jgi:hypothetical protein